MWKTYLAIGLGVALLCLAFFDHRFSAVHGPAYEMHAARSLETLNTAQSVYQSQYGRYAQSLEELGPPDEFEVRPTRQSADLIPRNLASGATSGYHFLLLPNPDGYRLLAFPRQEKFGERSFYSDETTIVRARKGRPAWKTDSAIN